MIWGNAEMGKEMDRNKKILKPLGRIKTLILFELPYQEHNLICQNLDVVHVNMNVCYNIIWTLLAVAKDSKDDLKARCDYKSS